MSEALTMFYYLFDKSLNCIFNELFLFNGVSVGWVLVVIILFGFMISNILAVPRAINPNLYYGNNLRHNTEMYYERRKGLHHK